MIKFDRLEKLYKDQKENRNALVFISIALVCFFATLIVSIIVSEIAMIVANGIGLGFSTASLIGIIISFKESEKAYLEEETKVLEELNREISEMLFNAMVEFDKAISNDIAKRKAVQEKAKAETEKPKEKKKAEPKAKAKPKAKAETKTTKKKN